MKFCLVTPVNSIVPLNEIKHINGNNKNKSQMNKTVCDHVNNVRENSSGDSLYLSRSHFLCISSYF